MILWIYRVKETPLPVPVRPFPNKTRSLSLLPAQTVSAKQGPLPDPVAVCRHRTVTRNPVPANPESFMETSRSAGALVRRLAKAPPPGMFTTHQCPPPGMFTKHHCHLLYIPLNTSLPPSPAPGAGKKNPLLVEGLLLMGLPCLVSFSWFCSSSWTLDTRN